MCVDIKRVYSMHVYIRRHLSRNWFEYIVYIAYFPVREFPCLTYSSGKFVNRRWWIFGIIWNSLYNFTVLLLFLERSTYCIRVNVMITDLLSFVHLSLPVLRKTYFHRRYGHNVLKYIKKAYSTYKYCDIFNPLTTRFYCY